jgi:dephospho-CoA kinase
MEKLGAAIVDCDKLGEYLVLLVNTNLLNIGHETYKIDTDVYKKIIETFGEDIINPVDRSINRKILGKKVFQSPDEMKKLTDIVWPAILNLAQERIDQFFKEGSKMTSLLT